jgi:hypothetical protein
MKQIKIHTFEDDQVLQSLCHRLAPEVPGHASLAGVHSHTVVETGQCKRILHSHSRGDLAKYLEEKEIQYEITTPETPQHKGVAERMNCTLNKVRAILLDARFPWLYWYDTLEYGALFGNVVPPVPLGMRLQLGFAVGEGGGTHTAQRHMAVW